MHIEEKIDFFTSDPHFGHVNIVRYNKRPWDDVDDMNEGLIATWNARVKPHHTVLMLGDMVMGKLRETMPILRRLNGRKLLVPGNHDRCWEGHKKVRPRDRAMYEEQGVVILPGYCTYDLPTYVDKDGKVEYETISLSHFPYQDSWNAKYREGPWYVEDDGASWLVHGHVHHLYQRQGRQINVGVDVWNYAPVSAAQLAEMIEANRWYYRGATTYSSLPETAFVDEKDWDWTDWVETKQDTHRGDRQQYAPVQELNNVDEALTT